ncbi:MAG TPA: SDR family NAD(P)-dependent oxidoreductase [Actinocrinis sp.]|nr:SDR family NAD(P)-dependent oxidoreductase [Actinocrinis sp.]
MLRGSAVNQDGASNGLTAPSGPAQQRVIRAALADAGLTATEVDAVEAHGTGTKLGDPIEARALLATYGQGRPADQPLWLGSLKSNIGHAQAAAGVAGVIKMVQAMENGVLPPTLYADEPSAFVDWDSGAVSLLTEPVQWPRGERPRRAAVSAFGISGTNAHVVIEEPAAAQRPADRTDPPTGPVPLVLSARTPQALREQVRGVLPLADDDAALPYDLGYALATTRAAFEHRAVVVGDRATLPGLLTDLAAGETGPGIAQGSAADAGPVVFVFPGQGTQWAGMARALWEESEVFAARMAECETALAPFVDWSLRERVFGNDPWNRVDIVQPALFAVMVSLAAVWRAFGVEPAAVVGHSQGEIAAAVVAGGLSLEDGAKVVALRSQAIGVLAGRGAMASILRPADQTTDLLKPWPGRISVAAVNGPAATVVSGDADAVAELLMHCATEGIRARRIDVDYASHSAQVEEIREDILTALAGIRPLASDIPFYSTVDEGWLDTVELDAAYWYRNLRRTVSFAPAVRALAELGHTAFLEISSHPVLAASIEDTVAETDAPVAALHSLRRDEGGMQRMLCALGEAWVCGLPVDWTVALDGTAARRVDLPTYPFQHRRYWPEPETKTAAEQTDDFWHELESSSVADLAEALDVDAAELGRLIPALSSWRADRAAAWRYRIGWQPLSLPPAGSPTGPLLLVEPEAGPGDVADALAATGTDLIRLTVPGPGRDRESLAALLRDAIGDRTLSAVLSLLADEPRAHPEHPDLPGGLALTLALAQALGDAAFTAPLWCATRGTAAVGSGEQPAAPAHGAVAGLGRVIALEHPDRWGGLVDLPPVLDQRAADRLRTVLAVVRDEDQVAVRATGVYGRRLHPAAQAPRARDGWPSAGTALITGGTGGLGAQLARQLAAAGVEHLLLLSRRGPDAPGAADLEAELIRSGAAVTIAACDVTDRAQLQAALAAIPAQWPLTAVFHSAGILDDGMVEAMTPARLDRQLRVKLTAATHLHELTAGHDLSAFVLFSSMIGTIGGLGQANYAAANAAVDAFAAARRAAGLPTTSVAWGLWAGDGMVEERDAGRLDSLGARAMDPAGALRVLGRILAGDGEDAVVADVDWSRFAATGRTRGLALFSQLPGVTPAAPATDHASRDRLAALPAAERTRALTAMVAELAARVLGRDSADAVDPRKAFAAQGFDSLNAVDLRNRLAQATGLRLPTTILFDHATPQALAAHLADRFGAADPADGQAPARPAGAAAVTDDEPIAIVGIGCRFPGGAHGPDAFWQLLAEGRDVMADWPEDRGWDTSRLYDPARERPGTTYSRRGGFLADAAGFDAAFFGISPREALAMDPQQRILLETCWEALEHAGFDPGSLHGESVGVFVGTNGQDYSARIAGSEQDTEGHFLTGNTASVLSGRVSYTLGLQGPALTVDTACSASLVALHLAVQALRRGECDRALTGGVTVMSMPTLFLEFSRQGALARDGRCKAFAAGADGTAWSEGAGVVVLERLSDAQRRGHRVLALVTGTAVNQDGASNGLTAPSGLAQQRVIRAALAAAGVGAGQVGAVEAHGTGTNLGDPVEAQALEAVYGERAGAGPLWLGAVKSNIGHTQAAAGIAGVIKMVLALGHAELPATLHAQHPSPHVDWDASGLRLLTESTAWPRTREPLRAGVSAFGISGTNAHVILQEAPAAETEAEGADPVPAEPLPTPLLLSAASTEGLRTLASRIGEHFDTHPDTDPADVAHTLAAARSGLRHRAAIARDDTAVVRQALTALAAGDSADDLVTGIAAGTGRLAFLFPGQGSQFAGAGQELYRADPAFAEALDEVFDQFTPHLDRPLREIMFAAEGTDEARLLDRTRYTQPALFALSVALYRLLERRGVRPDLLIGHSAGEIAAAHVAGVLTLPDACALVAARGRLMDELPDGGAMVAVEAAEDEARDLLTGDEVAIAAVNAPDSVVLSGDRDAVLAVAEQLRARGRRTRQLAVSHAFHSARMDPMLDAFRQIAETITYSAPQLTVISNLTGAPASADDLCDADYWVRHVRGTVRFRDGVASLHQAGATTFLEVGPGGALTAMLAGCLPADPAGAALTLLGKGRPEPRSLTAALAGLYVRGIPVTWPSAGRQVDLPTYPFEHRRFWIDPAPAAPADGPDWDLLRDTDAPALAALLDIDADTPFAEALPALSAWRTRTERDARAATLRYQVSWEPLTTPEQPRLTGPWLLVLPADAAPDVATAVELALAEHGAEVTALELSAETTRADLTALLTGRLNGQASTSVLSLLALGPDPLAATLRLMQAVADTAADLRLWCATTEAAQDSPPRPDQAQIWGFGRVAALEHPGRWGGLVDLPATLDAAAGRLLAAALRGGPGDEDQLAIRPAGLFARRLVRAAPAAPADRPRWKPTGTVLITGGTGGIGAAVARDLAADGAEHLVLAGRRGADAPGAADLAADLERSGARVTFAACDFADRTAVADLLDRLRETGDTPRAVLHAAGSVSLTPIADRTADDLAAELGAKADGASYLDELFGDEPLDAFVLFSSIAGSWGSGGQSGYAAANAHLDALAAGRRARGLAATSVAWGPWAETGMALGDAGATLHRYGLTGLHPAVAVAALRQAIANGDTHVVVADVDWARFTPTFTTSRPSPLLRGIPEAVQADTADAPDDAADRRHRIAALPAAERRDLLLDLVGSHAARALGHAAGHLLDPERPLRDLGFDSLTTVEVRNRLAEATGLTLPASLLFDHPTIAALGAHLYELLTETGSDSETQTPAAGPSTAPADPADPLAVVAMACRFAGGVRTPEDLWNLVAAGVDAVSPMPADRGWDLAALYDPDPDATGTFYTSGGGFLADPGDFDAEFFGISPREALAMDPQQRLLLETAWEVLERAGMDPRRLADSSGGVFVGVAAQGYGSGSTSAEVEGHLLAGNVTSVASGRIAYQFGLQGPAVTLDTACSSGLVALHLAGQALRAGECSFALVGGAAVMAVPDVFVEFSRQRGLSADGRCRSFAETADGTGWGEGAGMLLVERLSDARRNGHPVLAVVRGSAVNQDGTSNGLTAPNGLAQQRVIRQALANARLDAADVDLVEAHGTGTVLGDVVEAQALLATYGSDRQGRGPLRLGSLKSNIGHTQAAAGVAGVIKTVQALRHGVLPRTLHVDEPTSRVDWSVGEVELLTEALPWERDGRPRRAGVSAFGMSGTNAHVLLEEAPAEEPAPTATPWQPSGANAAAAGSAPTQLSGSYTESDAAAAEPVPWLLSARTELALRAQAARLRDHLAADPGFDPAAVAGSLAARTAFPVRAVLTGTDRETLLRSLTDLAENPDAADLVRGEARPGRTAFVFPGQGAQWPGMAAELLATNPVFAARIAECEAALAPHVDWSLTEVLRDRPGAASLDRVDVVQPALFAVMVALAAQWRAAGVQPDAVIGHSQGEIAAACVAGALSLADAAKTVALRSKALRRLSGGGGMVSLAVGRPRAEELIAPYGDGACVAAVNGPAAVVVAGAPEALAALLADCESRGVRARQIPVDYAAHSAQVEHIRAELLDALADVKPQNSQVPLYSTVTGERVDGELLDADYWYRNLRETVEFQRGVSSLLDSGVTRFVELSPHPVLTAAVQDAAEGGGRQISAVGSLRRGEGGWPRLLTSLGEAWCEGANVAWDRMPGLAPNSRAVPLPTYAFQPERYWLPSPGRHASAADSAPTTGPDQSPAYQIDWKPLAAFPAARLSGDWLLIVPAGREQHPAAEICAEALRQGGALPVIVPVATGASADDAMAGLDSAELPAGIISLLGLDEQPAPGNGAAPAGLTATVDLLRALDVRGIIAPLWCVTTGAVAVGDEPLVHADQAYVWGLGQVLLLEQESRFGGLLDLPAVPGADLAACVAEALTGGHGEDQIALRPDGAYARRLQTTTILGRPGRREWSAADGTALITAGLSDLTAELSRWLATRGATHILITGGNGPDEGAADSLRKELADLGAGLTVTDRAPADPDLLAELEGAKPVRTVVYSAVPQSPGATLSALAAAEIGDTAQAMVAAMRNLESLTGSNDPTFIVLTSLSGTWGAARHGAATAAATAAAARARQRRDRGEHALVLALGGQDDPSVAGDRPLPPGTVSAALQRLLDHDEASGFLADLDIDRIVGSVPGPRALGLIRDLPQVVRALRARPEADGAPAALAARLEPLDPPARRRMLLDLVTGHAAAVLGHGERSAVRPERAFADSGFDSMLAVQFRNRLRTATGVQLPATTVFDHPTPNALVDVLYADLCSETAAGARALAELGRLEAALADLAVDVPSGRDIGERLQNLVRRWSGPAAPGAAPDHLGSATADELFDLLDNEYGQA